MTTILALLTVFAGAASAAERLFIGLYGGQVTNSSIKEIYSLETSTVDSYLAAVFLGKEIGSYGDLLRTELEGQIVKHAGEQDHWEYNGAFVLRWLPFPWDDDLDTSLAFGLGLSYATEEPVIEIEKNDTTSKLLAYLMIEMDFALPRTANWSVFGRIHHRSGAWGTFDDVEGGSNTLCLGLKYSFN